MKLSRLFRNGLILALLILLPQAACSVLNRNYQRRLIPQKLATGWFYAEGNCGGLLGYQGAFAFDLAEETISALRREGLAFFDDINAPAKAAEINYFRGEWRSTPLPPSAFSDGSPGNLHCGEENSWWWPKGVLHALKHSGGYYQSSAGRSIYVLPGLGLVVGVASDR